MKGTKKIREAQIGGRCAGGDGRGKNLGAFWKTRGGGYVFGRTSKMTFGKRMSPCVSKGRWQPE